MAAIYPVLSSRVSDSMIQARLTAQFSFDQQELLRLQDQVSTGYRISTPSQDASAAIRAMALQRLLEQKQQAKTNLAATDSFISATDTALTGASDLLINVRALALSAINSTSSDEQRAVLRGEALEALEQLMDIGNRQFRGRYLFSGSRPTTQPFTRTDQYVVYQGNESKLQNYVDVDFLADSNLTGAETFGAISSAIRGAADLNPIITETTRLADLRGGRGITAGSIVVSDGINSITVDLSAAVTVGDVMEAIEANPPAGRQVTATLSGQGLVIELDDAGGGNLTVGEVAGGRTAQELGILETNGTGTSPLQGADTQPLLSPSTRLRNILGTRAFARLDPPGLNNDLYIEAVQNGPAMNNIVVQFVHSVATGNQAFASFDANAGTLTIDLSPGVTQASTVVDAINATGAFTAQLDDKVDSFNNGSGVFDLSTTGTTSGGSGENLDLSSGLQIFNAGQVYTLTFDDAETIEDLLNEFNLSDAQVIASINTAGTGIDVRTRVSGSDFMIGENGGNTASQLGLRSFVAETHLGDLNFGRGVQDHAGPDFQIRRRDGVTLDIDVASAQTVGDVIDLINNHPANVGNAVVARLAQFGNGIELVDANPGGTQELTVARLNGFAAWELGLVPRQADQAVAPTPSAGQPQVLTGSDVNPQEAHGVFNSLIKLAAAIENFDLPEIERVLGSLDENFSTLSFARADLGARGRGLQTLKDRIDREDVDLRGALSVEIDADVVQAIADLSSRQANLEASLRMIAQTFRLTVLDFL